MSRRRAAAIALAVTGLLGAGATAAHADPIVGPAGSAFYDVPANAPAASHGDLIQYRPATVKIGGAPEIKSWLVMYRTTSATGKPAVATGTVIVPTKKYTGKRPIVTYAVGTQGLGQQCAASAAYENGVSQYDSAGAKNALLKNFTVVSTDYQGYTTGDQPPPYIAGKGEAYDVLDIVKAASQIPDANVDATAKTAIWGYSQGGQAAAWAGQLEASYTPQLNVVGVAAGGVPADLAAVGKFLNGNVGAAFLGYAVIGLDKAYPGLIQLEGRLNDLGRDYVAKLKTQCTFTSLPSFTFQRIEKFQTAGTPIDQLLAEPGPAKVVADNLLGQASIPVPVFQYHASLDEIIPLGQAADLRKRYCARGMKVQWKTYPAEHLTGDFLAVRNVADWIADRVAGKAAPTNCPK